MTEPVKNEEFILSQVCGPPCSRVLLSCSVLEWHFRGAAHITEAVVRLNLPTFSVHCPISI